MICQRPVLLVEGDGDRAAVPVLVRRTADDLGLQGFDPAPKPIKTGSLAKLRTAGTVEKFVQYALNREDGDGVLLMVDCDDDCAWTQAHHIAARSEAYCRAKEKRLGIAFMCREFESIFLHDIATIKERYPEFGWSPDAAQLADGADDVRGCKERLSRSMLSKQYKETQHQVTFSAAVNIAYLRNVSRCMMHLGSTLEWITKEACNHFVYPFKNPL